MSSASFFTFSRSKRKRDLARICKVVPSGGIQPELFFSIQICIDVSIVLKETRTAKNNIVLKKVIGPASEGCM